MKKFDSEDQVKRAIKQYLDSLGAYWFCPVQMGYGARTVDFLCCVKGHFVAVEAKSSTGKARGAQMATLQEIRNAGGIALIENCADLSRLRLALTVAEIDGDGGASPMERLEMASALARASAGGGET